MINIAFYFLQFPFFFPKQKLKLCYDLAFVGLVVVGLVFWSFFEVIVFCVVFFVKFGSDVDLW